MGFVQDMDILEEAPSEIQKDFLAPDFYLNFFFLVFFFYSIKNIVINLVSPNMPVQSPFFVVKNCICQRPCI